MVDGRKFRWMLSGKSRYGSSPIVVIISIQEDIDKPGATLQCRAIASDIINKEDCCGDKYEYCASSILPSDIAQIIKVGLERGWDPSDGTGVFDPGNINLAQYKVIVNEPS